MKVLLLENYALRGATESAGTLKPELVDVGHDVRSPERASQGSAAAMAAAGESGIPWKPDVLLVRLEADSAAVLDIAVKLLSERQFAGAPVLFTGNNELALTAARRRFPDASFVRVDHLATALASLEANDS